MDAIITGESDRIGLSVIDNSGVEHLIEMDESGEIKYHEQDGYSDDPSERTAAENEHINQAKRYARYYVSRERGYETLDRRKDPANIATTALIVADLDTTSLSKYFDDLSQQVSFNMTGGEPVVELPAGLTPDKATYYQDIYLDLNEETRGSLSAITDRQSLQDILERIQHGLNTDTSLPSVFEDGVPAETPLANSPAATLIAAVSGIHICWADETEQYRVDRHGDPELDRGPDARLELMPFVPEDLEAFRLRLVKNLFCQVRDRYISMGITPPETFRLHGFGIYKYSTWYEHENFYQRYHDPETDIDWEIEPPEHRDE